MVRMGRAQEALDEIGAEAPSYEGYERAAALALAALGRSAEARGLADRAVANKEHGAERTMAEICAMAGDDRSAVRYFERAADRITGDSYDLLGAGRALHRIGNHRDAAALLQKGLRLADFLWPDDLAMLAESLRATGRRDAARDAYAMHDELIETGTIAP